MTFPEKGGPRSCLVEGCPGRVAKKTEMRVHFLNQYFLNTVVIMEEGTSLTHGAPNATCWSPGRP